MEKEISLLSHKALISTLKNDISYQANLELANRVVNNNSEAVEYFLTIISEPIVKYIENKFLKRDVYSDYYLFISSPLNEDFIPEWKKISLYKGLDCKLNTYVSCISCRHFAKVAKKEIEVAQKNGELIDYVDYEALLEYDCRDEEDENEKTIRMRKAFNGLSNKNRDILEVLLIDNLSGLDAFPFLEKYITPKPKEGITSEQIKASWTVKQKQDAMSLLKGRALYHLKEQFLKTSI